MQNAQCRKTLFLLRICEPSCPLNIEHTRKLSKVVDSEKYKVIQSLRLGSSSKW